VRLASDSADEGLFVRSMAARDRLGGLADLTLPAMVTMRALFDRLLVETVGVGQSETEIAGLADTVLFCVQPASGDSLQFMKAGIVEIPDVVAVTKADLGAAADRALADIAGALSLALDRDGRGRAVAVSARTGTGLDALDAALEAHRAWLDADGRLAIRRHRQAEHWIVEALRDRVGRGGLARAARRGLFFDLPAGQPPFARLAALTRRLEEGTPQ